MLNSIPSGIPIRWFWVPMNFSQLSMVHSSLFFRLPHISRIAFVALPVMDTWRRGLRGNIISTPPSTAVGHFRSRKRPPAAVATHANKRPLEGADEKNMDGTNWRYLRLCMSCTGRPWSPCSHCSALCWRMTHSSPAPQALGESASWHISQVVGKAMFHLGDKVPVDFKDLLALSIFEPLVPPGRPQSKTHNWSVISAYQYTGRKQLFQRGVTQLVVHW